MGNSQYNQIQPDCRRIRSKNMFYKCEMDMTGSAAEITEMIADKIRESGVENGLGIVYLPQTDAAVCITTANKPEVIEDILEDLNTMIPSRIDYKYSDNFAKASAHTKSALLGVSLDFIIADGAAALGEKQGVFILDLIGPRRLAFYIKIKAA